MRKMRKHLACRCQEIQEITLLYALQILWNHVDSMVSGNSEYSFMYALSKLYKPIAPDKCAYQTYLLIINQLEFRVLTYLPERLEQEIPRTL